MQLPFPGLLKSQREAARSIAQAAAAAVGDESRRVAAAVEWAWVELGFAQRALDVTDDNIELLRQFAKIAETKYRVGEGLQQNVIHAQAALTELLDERLERQAALRTAQARLGALLDLPVERPLPRTTSLRDAAPLPDPTTLIDRLDATSPRLQALAERIAAAQHQRRAVRLEGYPDFNVGLGYRVRQQVTGDPVAGDDFLGASVVVRLPLDRRKRRAQVAEQDALVRQSEAEHRRVRTQLRDAVMLRYADLERAIADRRIAFAAIEASIGAPLRPAGAGEHGG